MTAKIFLAVFMVFLPGIGSAADRSTCKMIEGLLKTTDRGLAAAAAGQADRSPSAGIATYAREAKTMADKFSTRDPLPDNVAHALSAMADIASSQVTIAKAAPGLLEHGLVVQAAMGQICPKTVVPDLARHKP